MGLLKRNNYPYDTFLFRSAARPIREGDGSDTAQLKQLSPPSGPDTYHFPLHLALLVTLKGKWNAFDGHALVDIGSDTLLAIKFEEDVEHFDECSAVASVEVAPPVTNYRAILYEQMIGRNKVRFATGKADNDQAPTMSDHL